MNKQEKTMTNDELKKKIVDIALHAEWMDMFGDHNSIGKYAANAIADALIAAGIGDVSELKKHRVIVEQSPVPTDDNCYILPNTSPIIKQLYSGKEVEQIAKERDEYKHRAERAERALENEIKNRINITGDVENLVYAYYGRAIYQAEKELAELKGGKE